MAIGEILSVALELNPAQWQAGTARAQAATQRFLTELEVGNARAARSMTDLARGYDKAAASAQASYASLQRQSISRPLQEAHQQARELERDLVGILGRMTVLDAQRAKGVAFAGVKYNQAAQEAQTTQDAMLAAQRRAAQLLNLDRQLEARRLSELRTVNRLAQEQITADRLSLVEREAERVRVLHAREEERSAREAAAAARERVANFAYLQGAAQRLSSAFAREAVVLGEAIQAIVVQPIKIAGQAMELLALTGGKAFSILGTAVTGFASVVAGTFAKLPLLGLEKGFAAGGGILASIIGTPEAIGNIASSVISAVASIRTALTSIAGSVVTGLASAFGTALQTGMSMAVNAATAAFIVASAGAVGALLGPAGIIGAAVLAAAATLLEGVQRFIAGFIGAVGQGISQAITAVSAAVTSIAQGAIQALTSLREIATAVINVVTEVASFMSQKASDLVEEANKFNVAFRDMAGGVNAALVGFGNTVGRSQLDLMNFAGTLQSTFMTMGFARDEAAGFSEKITKLSVDLGSFFNVADAKAFQGLESGIMGNHRALRQFGIGINQSTLGMELFSMGLGRTAKTYAGAVQLATEYEKATARLNIILRQTTEIQGDAARNANSFANTMKRVEAMVGDLASAIGQELNREIANFFNVSVDGATGMDHLRTIMYAVFLVSKDLAKELAQTAFAFVKMIRDGIMGLGGVEGVVARVRIGIEYIRQGAMLVQAAWTMLGPVWPSLVSIVTNSVKAIVAGFTYMEASAKAAWFSFQAHVVEPINKMRELAGWILAVKGFLTGQWAADWILGKIDEVGDAIAANYELGTDSALMAKVAAMDADAAYTKMTGAAANVSSEVRALGEYTQWAFQTMAGAATESVPHFTEAGSAVEAAFWPVAWTVETVADNIFRSKLEVISLEDQVAVSSQEMIKWFDAVANQFDFLRRTGALSMPGAEMSELREQGEMSYREGGPAPRFSNSERFGGVNPNADAANFPGQAIGGFVVGPPGHDRVPRRLTAGEFVVPAGVAASNRDSLEAMRSGKKGSHRGSNLTQNTTIILPQVRTFNADTYERQIKPAQARAARRTLPKKGK